MPAAASPNLGMLVSDPRFVGLDPASQRSALARATGDPRFTSISDDDLALFKGSLQGVRMGPAPPIAIPVQPPPANGVMNAISGLWNGSMQLGPVVMDALDHPLDTLKNLWSAQKGTAQQAVQDVHNKRFVDAAVHGGLSLVPGEGPIVSSAYDAAFDPSISDYERGQRIGNVLALKAGESMTPSAADLAPGTHTIPEAVPYAAEQAKNAATTAATVAKGAAKGAAKEAMAPVPFGRGAFGEAIGLPKANVPAIIARPVQGFSAGEAIGRLPATSSPFHAPGIGGAIGATAGAITPLVKGAVKGGKEALRDLRTRQQILSDMRDRPAPVYSGTPDVSYEPLSPVERQPTPDEIAFDQSPRTTQPSTPTPDINFVPQASPGRRGQLFLNGTDVERAGFPSLPPMPEPIQDLSYQPISPVTRQPTADELNFEQTPTKQVQSVLPDIAPDATIPPTPPTLPNWTGNPAALAPSGPQVPIVDISGRLPESAAQPATSPVAPDLTASSPLEQAQARQTHLESSGQAVPGTKILKVVPGEENTQAEVAQRADGQFAVVHRDMDTGEVVSTTITPDRAKAEAIANSIQLQPGAAGAQPGAGLAPDLAGTGESPILKDLINVVKNSEDKNAERYADRAGTIGHDLTVDKNDVIAQHLADNGITRAQWEPLTEAQKNDWIKKVNKAKGTNYKKLGADYDPSPNPRRFGRSAAVGASDIADALDRAWSKKKSNSEPIVPIQPPIAPVQPAVAASVPAPVQTPSTPESPSAAPAPPQRPFLGAKRPPAVPDIAALANDYNASIGRPPVVHTAYEDPSSYFARYTADAYDKLKADNSADPAVRAAYDALAKEVNAQWDFAKANGITMEPWTKEGQPYANSTEMVNDLANNKHLYFFQGGEPHPLLSGVDPETGLSANDKFRAIHDIFGHAAGGFGFGPKGEEAAYQAHSQMFSPEAARAMATETRGQNSWVNFGPQNYEDEIRKDIPLSERPYAQQKADLLPPEFIPPDAQARRVSFGLDTGEGTPFRHEGITTISPKTADWALRNIAANYGVGIMSEDIGRGAYLKSTEPAMHFEIVGAPKNILDFMTAGGHALQQTEVIGTRALKAGKSYAFDIIQKGGKDLASDAERDALFHGIRKALGDDADLVPGYQSIEKNGEPGLRFLKFDGKMTPEEITKIEDAAERALTARGLKARANHFPMDLLSVSNDWRVNPNGESYTRRLTGSGQGPGRVMDDQFWRAFGSRIEADRAAGLTGQPAASGGKPGGR